MPSRFLNNITINDEYTLPSTDGTADQIITTDGAGQLGFVDQSTLNSGSAERTEILVKNLEGSSLSKGDPVYIIGSVGASDRLKVGLADAGNSDKMPCVGLLTQDLANNGEGTATVNGKLKNLITSPIDGATPTENDTIYVKSGGGLTLTKPTGSTNLIQNVGQVGRVSTSSDGNIVVSAILRSNDVPNLPTGRIWIGDGNTIVSDTVYVDEPNNRVGINTSSPQAPLEAKYTGFADEIVRIVGPAFGKPQMTFYNDTALHTKIVAAGNDDFSISNTRAAGDMFFYTGGATRLHIEANGNVGIGTVSPSTKLEVVDTFSVQRTSTDNEGLYVTVSGTDANAIVETFYQEDSSSMYGIRKRYDGSTNLYQEFIHDNSAAGTEIYRVDRGTKNTSIANGNVGIGTTSPTNSKLEVVGEIDATGGDGYRIEGKPWAYWSSDLLTLGDWDGEGYATRIVGNNSDNELRVTDTGVGIGISDPATKLHMGSSGSSASTTEEFRIQTSTGGGYGGNAVLNLVTGQYGTSGIYFGNNATYTSQLAHMKWIDVSYTLEYNSSGSHVFKYSNSEIFRTNGTNIGMGVTGILAAKLDILSSGRALNVYSTQSTGIKVRGGGNSLDIAQFYNISNTAAMVLDSVGQLGIGTNDPQAELHVQSISNQAPTIRLNHNSSFPEWMIEATQNNSASPPVGQLRWDANPGAYGMELIFWSGYSKNSLKLDGQNFIVTTGGSEKMRIDSAGDVGIGVTNPAEKLEVNGHVKAVDGYKGYVSYFHNGGFFHSPRSTDGANPIWIPVNSTAMNSGDQYYNTWVPLYAGRVRKIILKHVSGSTPVATVCTFRKRINGTTSGTTYAGTVTGGGAAGMKVTFDFGTSNFTFNAEDEVQIGVVTGVATQPRMGGMSCQIWYEYNIT